MIQEKQTNQKIRMDFDFNRIYPYSTKPKLVPILKKLIALIFLVVIVVWYSIYIYSALYLKRNITSIQTSVNTVYSQSRLTIAEQADTINILLYGYIWNKIIYSVLFMAPLIVIYLVYQSFKKEKYEKNIYSFSVWYIVITIAYFLLITFIVFWDANYFLTHQLLKWVPEQYRTGLSLQTPRENLKKFGVLVSNTWVEGELLANNLVYNLTKWAGIVVSSCLFLNVVITAFLFFIKPKYDLDKVRKIQHEIQKKAKANLEGKDYTMDTSIFD